MIAAAGFILAGLLCFGLWIARICSRRPSRSRRQWNECAIDELLAIGSGLYLGVIGSLASPRDGIMMSLGADLFAFALVSEFLWRRDRNREERLRGCCPYCEYNLTGNVSGICPECGNNSESMLSRYKI